MKKYLILIFFSLLMSINFPAAAKSWPIFWEDLPQNPADYDRNNNSDSATRTAAPQAASGSKPHKPTPYATSQPPRPASNTTSSSSTSSSSSLTAEERRRQADEQATGTKWN